ncbi:MAG: hypothetical protein D6798_06280 [Deltaproteobacteria bacterium]|nr:MAG: hypothetical protein D6798_06280 [Deltaproteobacteria bacterium]
MNAVLLLLLACVGGGDTGVGDADRGVSATSDASIDVPHPFVAVRQRDRAAILDRVGAEPWATILARIEERAARDYLEDDEGEWDHDNNGTNGTTAQAAAFLGWLRDDPEMTAKAIDFLDRLETDFENNSTWDVNIRMPAPLIGYTAAWDLLVAQGALTADQEAAFADKLATITGKFFDAYVADDAVRLQMLTPAQNNHPLRTAAAVGVPALALIGRDDRAEEWLSWAASEVSWLLGPDGQYVQADGAVSEGPFYYGFGLSAVLGFLVAMDNAVVEGTELTWDCRNRIDMDPFTTAGCIDGAPLRWHNPLRDPWFQRTLSWSLALRLPGGLRPPLADANLVQQNGGALVAATVRSQDDAPADLRADAPAWVWDWLAAVDYPADTTRSHDLSIQHLARLDRDLVAAAAPPSWTHAFRDEGGNAVLRTGWGDDDLWALLVAEHGSVRKTLHDHVDSLSFSLMAYGEYLLLDPGYYKPDELDNAVTADADSHNVILVDGQGAPDKGLLYNWGDTDAFLDLSYVSGTGGEAGLAYAEARQRYEDVDFQRGLLLARDRYLVVLDRTESAVDGARRFSWRLSGNAGYDAGGSFSVDADRATWERDLAGVDVVLAATRPDLALVEPPLVEGEPPHVHQFDLERAVGAHGVVDGEVDAVAPGFAAVLAPYRPGLVAGAGEGRLQVERLDLDEGVAALLVDWEGHRDLVLVREADAPEALTLPDGRSLVTDARGLFLADVGAGGSPTGVLLADGSTVTLDGEELCASDVAVDLCAWSGDDAPTRIVVPGG